MRCINHVVKIYEDVTSQHSNLAMVNGLKLFELVFLYMVVRNLATSRLVVSVVIVVNELLGRPLNVY